MTKQKRTFLSTTNADRTVHMITVKGSGAGVMLAFRAPAANERGFYIGYDMTVAKAVKDILADWNGEDPPGWVAHGQEDPRPDGCYAVTILAAWDEERS